MRIAPAAIYFHRLPDDEFHKKIGEISGITHAHKLSVETCVTFSKALRNIIFGKDKDTDWDDLRFIIQRIPEENIKSSGFVVHTLDAAMWCFLTSSSYKETVLKAVNLGGDTDTTACVTGALAGLYYGVDQIPDEWKTAIARREDIRMLATKFTASIPTQ